MLHISNLLRYRKLFTGLVCPCIKPLEIAGEIHLHGLYAGVAGEADQVHAVLYCFIKFISAVDSELHRIVQILIRRDRFCILTFLGCHSTSFGK